MLVYTNRNGRTRLRCWRSIRFRRACCFRDEVRRLEFSATVSGTAASCCIKPGSADRSLELRLTDLPTNRTRRLYATAPDYPHDLNLSPAWSPDGALIAFSARPEGNSEILSIKPDGTGLRNLTRNPLLDATPAFSADGREIIFARDAFGQAHLYRMDTNGGGQRRVTNASGYEMSPAVSPDGRHLAFAGDRSSRGLDILSLDLARAGAGARAGRPSRP